MSEDLLLVLVVLGTGVLTGVLGPVAMRRLPEPELDAPPAEGDQEPGDRLSLKPVHEKVAYAVLADRPGVPYLLGVLAAAAAAVLAFRIDDAGPLVVALVAVPSGTVLGYVDARTTFLPTRIVWPTLGLVALVALAVAVASGEGDDVRRAALGCVLYGGVFYVLWWLTPGFGFGDVRLAFLLGAVLGFLGWEELGIGFAAALFLGGFGGALLVLLKVVDARRSPYGPHMLVGAVVGAGFGPALAGVLGY